MLDVPERFSWKTQLQHYEDKLAYEIDSWDLKVALEAKDNVIVVDARSPQAYAVEHIPGAINIPYRQISPESTARLDKAAIIISYCDGIGCSASTKGTLAMTKLGFRVKELMGLWNPFSFFKGCSILCSRCPIVLGTLML
jgi:rhodanese-related sulfurtransferase